MPFCRHCGVEHADSDRFCPSCGRSIGDESPAVAGPGPGLPAGGPRRGVTAVLEHALGALWQRDVWRLGLTAALALALQIAAAAGAALALAYASFSTISPHRILRTACFVHNPLRPGAYTIRNGCDPIRPRVDAGTLLTAGPVVLVLLGAVVALTSVAVYRRCDRQVGDGRPRSILPGPRACLRVVYRVVGWGLVAAAAFLLLSLAVAIPLSITAATTAGGARVLLLLGEVAALTWLGIWWVVPFCVRVYLAGLRMVLDDLGLVFAYEPMRALGRGQAWGFIGLWLVLSISVSIVASIAGLPAGALPGGTWVAQVVFSIISTLVLGTFAVAMMRNTAGELPPPAPRGQPAGYEYQAGGSEPGAGGSAA